MKERLNSLPSGARRAGLSTVLAVTALLGTVGMGVAHAQSDNGTTLLQSKRISSGTPLKVTLLQSLNSGTAQVGDQVRGRVATGDTSGLPRGTYLIGRVTQVRAATTKQQGTIDVQFGIAGQDTSGQPLDDDRGASATGQASAHLVGPEARSEKSQYTTIGAGAGAVVGLARKGKLGDAITGAILGSVGGYAADQAQKRPGGDVNLVKGKEVTVRLNTPLTLRTVIVAPY